ncbi:hypothetical protein DICPUDRAFT_82640 [Dictyostelium purpureum]|uniref:N-acetyltransferase domain-containing protein n=1 Tax=Dictyostelium purpureum TaxID=5786 RepID=F0ZX46_DICPU|nr:uncharacterized protein DICPUDRAFT_82640 [Dictyostelium purpureum]EGC31479.1 hypothetical protein DICPUDRAFT_82640 [Dictyostelium purpureum]|eukprot:XP_003291984.1 hypothetical protein DICPUDRAFT_82640 [Dictyostelium purpureum]
MQANEYSFFIKPATIEDLPIVYKQILELVEYQNYTPKYKEPIQNLEKYAFGKDKIIHIYCGWLVPFDNPKEGVIVGYTIHFLNFSTFYLRPGIYLEDIYVKDEYRGCGYGKKMLLNLCKIAKENNYTYVELQVLESNKSSIQFYELLKGKPVNGWIQYRLENDGFEKYLKDN